MAESDSKPIARVSCDGHFRGDTPDANLLATRRLTLTTDKRTYRLHPYDCIQFERAHSISRYPGEHMLAKVSATLCLLVSIAGSGPLNAQSCVGQLSLRETHVNGGLGLRMVSQGHGIEGRVAGGNDRLFAAGTVGTIGHDHGDGGDGRSYLGGVEGGYSHTIGRSGVSVCPMLAATYEKSGPGNFVSRNELRGFAGLSLGGAKSTSQSLSLVSFVGGGLQTIRATQTIYGNRSTTGRRTGGQLMGGIGVQYRQRALARASVWLPAGFFEEYGDQPAYFLLGLTFSPARAAESR